MFWVYAVFLVFVAALLALDLGVFHRKAHRIGGREALGWSALWIALSVAFAGVVYAAYENGWGALEGERTTGGEAALAYLTAYVVEKSLAVDNIFVIALIFGFLRVPERYQHRVLFWGIVGALFMRGAMIAAGATLVAHFEWVLYVFGGFLVFTGLKSLRSHGPDFDPEKSRTVTFFRRMLRIPRTGDARDYGGAFIAHTPDGRWCGTTLLHALLVVELCDVMFAVDSIPAVFTVTHDPFLVFASNIMAILGMRSLYFVLADMLHRFVYLKPALGVVLLLVGVKMLAHEPLHALLGDHFPWVTLVTVLAVLLAGVVASLLRPKPSESEEPLAPPDVMR